MISSDRPPHSSRRRFLKTAAAIASLPAVHVLGQGTGPSPASDAAVSDRIAKHRTASAILLLTGPDGKPVANSEVTVRQARHQFLFGCNAFGIAPDDPSPLQRDYQRRFGDLLNYGTLGFYWGSYERTEGQPSTNRLTSMARWCAEHGILTKGHPLCWHQVFPRWLENKPLDEIRTLQLGRITREVSAFAGLIDRWDVVNEAVVMPTYKGERTRIPELCNHVGRLDLIRETFAAARAANPRSLLVLNDYDTSIKYEQLIREVLDAGVPVDVIGIQSHMHAGAWGAEKAWSVCERFATFGKPLHFTETTLISGPRRRDIPWQGPRLTDWHTTPEDEAKQAEQVVEFYTTLYSHPAVQAITWWDFSDRGAWLGAPAGLIRADMTPKPAYDELMKRIKGEWWTPETRMTTDATGRLTLRGSLGDYALSTGGRTTRFSLESAGDQRITLRFT